MTPDQVYIHVSRWLSRLRRRKRRWLGPELARAIDGVAQARGGGGGGPTPSGGSASSIHPVRVDPGGHSRPIDPIATPGIDTPRRPASPLLPPRPTPGDGSGIVPVAPHPGGEGGAIVPSQPPPPPPHPGGNIRIPGDTLEPVPAPQIDVIAGVASVITATGGQFQAITPQAIGTPRSFIDDFSVNDIGNYKASGTWSIAGGTLQFTAVGTGPGRVKTWILYAGDVYQDVAVEVTVTANPGDNPAIVLRSLSRTSADDCYSVEFDAAAFGTSFRILKYVGGVETILTTDTWALHGGDTVKATIVGDTIKVYQNGVLKNTVVDATHGEGYCGLAAPGAGSPTFDDLEITPQ